MFQHVSEEVLLSHISSGIDMLRNGDGLSAYDHFKWNYSLPEDPQPGTLIKGILRPGHENLRVSVGMRVPITQLLSEEDLVFAASTVAGHSRAKEYSAEIGGWHTGDWKQDYSDTSRYNPNIVDAFHYEAGLVAAEEWVHILQAQSEAPVAGQDDVEVDVAAYFADEGLGLSADFITRYDARARWCISTFPERKNELIQFGERFGRAILNIYP